MLSGSGFSAYDHIKYKYVTIIILMVMVIHCTIIVTSMNRFCENTI